jgi:hypothetical protein
MHWTSSVLVPRKEARWYHHFRLFLALFQRQREKIYVGLYVIWQLLCVTFSRTWWAVLWLYFFNTIIDRTGSSNRWSLDTLGTLNYTLPRPLILEYLVMAVIEWYSTRFVEKILGDSGGKINFWGGNIVGLCEKKCCMNMRLIVICYWDRAVWIFKYKSIVNDNKEKVLTVNCI